jgi:phage gpG-like protein
MAPLVEIKVTEDLPILDESVWRNMAKDIGFILIDEIRLNFGVGGRPERWKPLASGQPSFLFESGDLLQSLQMTNGVVEEIAWAEVATAAEYAGYIQNGTTKMAARPFAVLSPEGLDRIMEIVGQRVVEVMTTTGQTKKELS